MLPVPLPPRIPITLTTQRIPSSFLNSPPLVDKNKIAISSLRKVSDYGAADEDAGGGTNWAVARSV